MSTKTDEVALESLPAKIAKEATRIYEVISEELKIFAAKTSTKRSRRQHQAQHNFRNNSGYEYASKLGFLHDIAP